MFLQKVLLVSDVNMVAEPKPHQTGRKRQNVAKTGNDWYVIILFFYKPNASALNNVSRIASGLWEDFLLPKSSHENLTSTEIDEVVY